MQNYLNLVILQTKIWKKHNSNYPEIHYNPYRILIVRGFGSGKTNALLGLISHEPEIDQKK